MPDKRKAIVAVTEEVHRKELRRRRLDAQALAMKDDHLMQQVFAALQFDLTGGLVLPRY